MDTFNGTELHRVYLDVPSARRRWEELLGLVSLTPGEEPDYVVGVSDSDGRLVGTASLHQDIIKYVAIHPDHRGEAIANALVSDIISHAAGLGVFDLVIFTKPEYASLFTDLSFSIVGRSATSVMLERSVCGLFSYKKYLEKRQEAAGCCNGAGRTGVIVMNANPPTKGHIYLIKECAAKVSHLFIIPLADNKNTLFSYNTRRNALTKAVSSLSNVTVVEGSRYCISASTFPSYFIKELSERTESHIRLDLDIFASHIAPSLGADIRFVGEEPTDPLTARYNELMKQILPLRGIEVVEIPRLKDSTDNPVSASRVRASLADMRVTDAVRLLPAASIPAVLAKAAVTALKKELDLTPKPGLVDKENSGAHSDMDYSVMLRSIVSLESVYERIAEASMNGVLPDALILGPIGIDGERAMLEATGGVNTHRGALFSLGLAVSATAFLLSSKDRNDMECDSDMAFSADKLSGIISRIADTFNRPAGTHGAVVREKHDIPTAIDMASDGYSQAFMKWRHIENPHLRLLVIMSELEDSNIYHRGGKDGAEYVRQTSCDILDDTALCADQDSLCKAMSRFNEECVRRWLSPGGCADMLALTFYLDSVIR